MGAKLSSRSRKKIISSTADLADYLGISEWTVSRAINGHPEVKSATRERVLLAMEHLGFRPNPLARALNGKSTGIVGICFGNPRNPLISEKIASLDEFLRENRLRGVLAITPRDDLSEKRIIEDFHHIRVDGVILVQSYIGVEQAKAWLKDLRCVHVDPASQELRPFVTADRHRSMRLLVDHLVGLGHRSFATLGFSKNNPWRWQGLTQALEFHGIDAARKLQAFELETPGRESFAEGIELARMVRSARDRHTAWIAVNDHVAMGAIQHVQDTGLSVPGDVSITGFDNLEVGHYLRPTLTSIDQRVGEMMKSAVELLLAQLNEDRAAGIPSSTKIEPQLLIRESTGPASKARK